MAQSVARRLGKAEVTGSSPANSLVKNMSLKKTCVLIFLECGEKCRHGL